MNNLSMMVFLAATMPKPELVNLLDKDIQKYNAIPEEETELKEKAYHSILSGAMMIILKEKSGDSPEEILQSVQEIEKLEQTMKQPKESSQEEN